jgi:predicted nucleic acid-binding protein
MRERQRLANNASIIEKRVLDVNVLAIFLAKGHPGCEYISTVVKAGLGGAYVPILLDVLPMRAYWIMTRRWGLPEIESAASIEYFVNTYDAPCYVGLTREAILESFRLSKELKHDVFDCMYLALALQEKAAGIMTTDTDFEKLCKHVGLKYVNPVPKDVLKRFKEQNK